MLAVIDIFSPGFVSNYAEKIITCHQLQVVFFPYLYFGWQPSKNEGVLFVYSVYRHIYNKSFVLRNVHGYEKEEGCSTFISCQVILLLELIVCF